MNNSNDDPNKNYLDEFVDRLFFFFRGHPRLNLTLLNIHDRDDITETFFCDALPPSAVQSTLCDTIIRNNNDLSNNRTFERKGPDRLLFWSDQLGLAAKQ